MCPIRVHWHVKVNYKEYWRVKIAIVNFNYRMNYSLWSLVIHHPNLNNVTQVFSFNYQPLVPYESISECQEILSWVILCEIRFSINTPVMLHADDTGLFYGTKYYNDVLMQAGPLGNVQSEVLLQKDLNTFTFKQGWAFPRKVYFNGDECMLPPPDTYPFLPNSGHGFPISFFSLISTLFSLFYVFIW